MDPEEAAAASLPKTETETKTPGQAQGHSDSFLTVGRAVMKKFMQFANPPTLPVPASRAALEQDLTVLGESEREWEDKHKQEQEPSESDSVLPEDDLDIDSATTTVPVPVAQVTRIQFDRDELLCLRNKSVTPPANLDSFPPETMPGFQHDPQILKKSERKIRRMAELEKLQEQRLAKQQQQERKRTQRSKGRNAKQQQQQEQPQQASSSLQNFEPLTTTATNATTTTTTTLATSSSSSSKSDTPTPTTGQVKVQVELMHRAEKPWKKLSTRRVKNSSPSGGPSHGDGEEPWAAKVLELEAKTRHFMESSWDDDTGRWDEKVEDIDVVRRTQGIVNKLTDQNFLSIKGQFCELYDFEAYLCLSSKSKYPSGDWSSVRVLGAVLHVFFDKAIAQPSGSRRLAELLREKYIAVGHKSEDLASEFFRIIAEHSHKEFGKLKRNESSDGEHRAREYYSYKFGWSLLDNQRTSERQQREMVGTIRLLAELFNVQLLPTSFIAHCICELKKGKSHLKLNIEGEEAICILLTFAGQRLEAQLDPKPGSQNFIDFIFNDIKKHLIGDLEKRTKLPFRVRFALLNLVELRERRWVPRPSAEDIIELSLQKLETSTSAPRKVDWSTIRTMNKKASPVAVAVATKSGHDSLHGARNSTATAIAVHPAAATATPSAAAACNFSQERGAGDSATATALPSGTGIGLGIEDFWRTVGVRVEMGISPRQIIPRGEPATAAAAGLQKLGLSSYSSSAQERDPDRSPSPTVLSKSEAIICPPKSSWREVGRGRPQSRRATTPTSPPPSDPAYAPVYFPVAQRKYVEMELREAEALMLGPGPLSQQRHAQAQPPPSFMAPLPRDAWRAQPPISPAFQPPAPSASASEFVNYGRQQYPYPAFPLAEFQEAIRGQGHAGHGCERGRWYSSGGLTPENLPQGRGQSPWHLSPESQLESESIQAQLVVRRSIQNVFQHLVRTQDWRLFISFVLQRYSGPKIVEFVDILSSIVSEEGDRNEEKCVAEIIKTFKDYGLISDAQLRKVFRLGIVCNLLGDGGIGIGNEGGTTAGVRYCDLQ